MDSWEAFPTLAAPAAPASPEWGQYPESPGPQQTAAAKPEMGFGERFLHGLANPLVGAAQLGAHLSGGYTPEQLMLPPEMQATMTGPAAVKAADEFVNNRQADFEARRSAAGHTGTDWAELAGNVASPMNFIPLGGPGGSLLSRLGMGAIQGGVTAAQQPVSGQDFWAGKAEQAGAGAALGAPLGAISPGMRGAVNPNVQTLTDAGVALTPGQAGGNVAKGMEGVAYKIPLVNSLAKASQQKAIDSFNTATLNQVLKPIGEELPAGMIGHEAMEATRGKLNDFYQALMPKLSFSADDPFVAGFAQLEHKLPLSQRAEFYRLASPTLSENLSGDALKALDSDLATWAAKYNRAGALNPESDALGEALGGIRDLMREQMMRANPESVAPLNAADKSWAMLKVAQKAAAGAGKDEGVFTPSQLLTASKNARGSSEQQFAEGNALLQPFGTAAQNVIGSSRGASNSPATMRDLIVAEGLQALMTGSAVAGSGASAGAQAGYLPEWLKWAGAAALPAMMFTRGGQGLLSTMGPGGPIRSGMNSLLQPAAPAVTGGLLGGY